MGRASGGGGARGIMGAPAAFAMPGGGRAGLQRPPPHREATIAERVAQYGPAARARLAPYFAAAYVPYPPQRFVLLGFKRERELQLIAYPPGGGPVFIRSYPILGASGELGPKLREGDG